MNAQRQLVLAPMARRRAAKSGGTYHERSGERTYFTYFDTEVIAATATTYRMFLNGLGSAFVTPGGPWTVKNEADTNLMAKGIPSNETFSAYHMDLGYVPYKVLTDAIALALIQSLAGTLLRVRIQGKDVVFERPILSLLGVKVASVGMAAATNFMSLPWTNHTVGMKLRVPIILERNTTYWVEVIQTVAPGSDAVGDKLTIFLTGARKYKT